MCDVVHTRMFQMENPPPKLVDWQDYFVRIRQGEDCICGFLHHCEPILNDIADRFCRRYGLDKHVTDIKMTYITTMLAELRQYDPECGIPFLQLMHRKLTAAMHTYAMSNLKGFSETSLTRYAQLRKAAYLYKTTAPDQAVATICKELNIQPKTALRLIEQVDALDTFRSVDEAGEDNEDYDSLVGKDVLGYRQSRNPETVVIHQEQSDALWAAFDELTTKERDIISLHLGFCMECFRTITPQTFDDLADLYQYTAADSVMKLYHRALEKLRSKLGTKE